MKLTISKSKNAESFYISKSYRNNNGKSTTINIRKLGTLKELQELLGTDRDGVVVWAKEQVRIETEKYKAEQQQKEVQITFHADRLMDYNIQRFYQGGYLFLQSIYYQLGLNKICRKIKAKYTYEYDLNAILSDLIYTRILEPDSKRSSYQFAQKFLEPPEYELHDVYRALSVLAEQCDLIQSEVYKNSHFLGKRNDRIMYYDCTNYYFEIEQEDGIKRYGKSKEHRPNPIVQMGLFMDGDGIPVAFSLFPGNQNEQKSLKPLETKVIRDLGCKKFVYCSDAGLGSEDNRFFNHIGERSFIVTQSIKKLPEEEREWALNGKGFRRVRDNIEVDITKLGDDDMNDLFYKEIPYTTKQLDQRLIITYSPKYAAYQKKIREKQIERAESMIKSGNTKKSKNPNDPARFIKKTSVTKEGEIAEYQSDELDMDKILEETKYDGLYAVCTDLLEDFVWDFTTSQANGTISCVALTHKWAGLGYMGDTYNGTKFVWTMRSRNGESSGKTRTAYINTVEVDFENNFLWTIGINKDNEVIIQKLRVSFTSIGLNDTMIGSNYDVLFEIKLNPALFVMGNPDRNEGYYDFFDGKDGYWYGFWAESNISGSANIKKIKINKSDYSFTEDTMLINDAEIQAVGYHSQYNDNPQRIVRSVLQNGFLYMVSYDKTKVYKINIDNPADVKEIPLGFTSKYTCNDDYYRSGSMYLANIGDWIVGSDFLIDSEDRVFRKANNVPWAYTSTPLFRYGPYLFSFGGYNANATRQNLFLATPYLATINNLETSVIKTADKTMKITYTIQEE